MTLGRSVITALATMVVLAALPGRLAAQAAQGTAPPRDLTRATIEDLMNITVTSAGRKEQRAEDVAGAVFVLTREDIRRSGMTTLPGLLRLVPGVQVAQINGNKWAVSVRGFNGLYSNKLLVLIDGRSVYSRLFSGVLWDAEEVMLEDVERIEVIRGPGGAVWGANAVNGVINIVTRSAADTQGALVRVGGGTFDRAQAAVRYGGSVGNLAYRVYSQSLVRSDSQIAAGVGAGDRWRTASAGFRSDYTGTARAFTLEGSISRGQVHALWLNLDPTLSPGRPLNISTPSAMSSGMLLGRWTRTLPSGASVQVQSVFDVADRDEPVGAYDQRTADVDVEYHRARARHDVVAGAGYRLTRERFAGRTGYRLDPEISNDERLNVFAQDEVALAPRLHGIVGAKIEHDGLSGWGVQPTLRVRWDLVPGQHLWAATSRALRTPSLSDRGIHVDLPPVLDAGPLPIRVSVSGSADTRTEELADLEAGYRLDFGSVATIAATGFYGRYQNLQTSEPGDPSVIVGPGGAYLSVPVRLESRLGAETRGVEVDAHWTPLPSWRLDASYAAFHLTPRLAASSRDPAAAAYDGDVASAQWQVHSGWSIARGVELDTRLFHVGALKALGVPAYTRADVRAQVPLGRRLMLSVIGQNLLDPRHAEFAGSGSIVTPTLIPRTARVQLAWTF